MLLWKNEKKSTRKGKKLKASGLLFGSGRSNSSTLQTMISGKTAGGMSPRVVYQALACSIIYIPTGILHSLERGYLCMTIYFSPPHWIEIFNRVQKWRLWQQMQSKNHRWSMSQLWTWAARWKHNKPVKTSSANVDVLTSWKVVCFLL